VAGGLAEGGIVHKSIAVLSPAVDNGMGSKAKHACGGRGHSQIH